MKFIGRKDELNRINKELLKESSSFILLYGRRRVGKSELIKEALKDFDGKKIYYECKQISEKSNVKSITDIISKELNLPPFNFKTIEETLDYLYSYALNEKLVLVLDEYPFISNAVVGLDSIIQSLVDKYKRSSKLKLIILGSYVETMKKLLEYDNPMYGRFDLIIKLNEMDYYDSSLFYQNYSSEDKIKIYSVFGGIPFYNELIDDSKSVKENIIDLIASNNSRLDNEISSNLRLEISKITNANEVFDALSLGYSKFNDILDNSHVSSPPTLVDVLNKLIKMEIVEKIAPINDEKNKKKTGYFISDNFSLFYYRYIFRYLSQRRMISEEDFYNLFIDKDFNDQYIPKQFEGIAKQYLIKRNIKGLNKPLFTNIGKYYYDNPKNHKNGEFDVVTIDENGYVFYECKFKKNKLSKSLIEDEIRQVKDTGLDCYKYVFISKNKETYDGNENVEFISLDDLYHF